MKREVVWEINPDLCTGCRLCELWCSFRSFREFNLAKAKLKVIRFEKSGLSVPLVCKQCEEAYCMSVCPTDAISISSKTGCPVIRDDLCIGCFSCAVVCPFAAIRVDVEKGKAMKCDLCDGDPMCVKVCKSGAIRLVKPERAYSQKQIKEAKEIASSLIKASER
jgi:Fe-S-cluster-containing hydrogenase component 2